MQIYQMQKIFSLTVAFACGILALFLLNTYLKRRENQIWEKIKQVQQQTQPAKSQVMKAVLVANKDIPPQVPITRADLSIKEMPAEYIQPQAATPLDEVVGQISSAPITAGEQILKNKLLPPGKISKRLSEITPEGKRAVNVSVDNSSGMVSLIRPGDYVDVFVLISAPSGVQTGTEKSTPRLIPLFQSVKVLAVGGEFVAAEDAQTTKKEQARGASAASGTITLALSPQESVLFSFAQEQGKIKLTVRSSGDTGQELIKPADWNTLLQYLSTEKELVREGKQPVVEIYRGLNKEIVPLSEKEK